MSVDEQVARHDSHAPGSLLPGCWLCADRKEHVDALLESAKSGTGPLASLASVNAYVSGVDVKISEKALKALEGQAKADEKGEHAILLAIRREVHELTADGKKLTARTANRIGALMGVSLKLVKTLSEDVRDLLPSHRPGGLGPSGPFGGVTFGPAGYGAASGEEAWDDEAGLPGSPLVTAPPIETFGTAALRELMAAIPKFMDKKKEPGIEELVSAAKTAKEAGMDDVAEVLKGKIRAKLGGVPAMPVVAPEGSASKPSYAGGPTESWREREGQSWVELDGKDGSKLRIGTGPAEPKRISDERPIAAQNANLKVHDRVEIKGRLGSEADWREAEIEQLHRDGFFARSDSDGYVKWQDWNELGQTWRKIENPVTIQAPKGAEG